MRRRNSEPSAAVGRVLDVDSATAIERSPERGQELALQAGHLRPTFCAFYAEAQAPVTRALAVALGDAELGAEAAHEAMARCFAHWSRVGDYDNPAGWVYRVGLNWGRSVRRRMARKLPFLGAVAVEPPPVADPQIQQALSELTIELRSVVVCRFLLDWSVQQTADALNVKPGTVKSRVHRALGLLENKLYSLE